VKPFNLPKGHYRGTKDMAIAVQFAFQGGGARLALLLPVVKAILDLEAAGEIVVTRTAGTSAGAIAAALVSGRAEIDKLEIDLRTKCRDKPEEIKSIFPSISNQFLTKAFIMWQLIVRNKPLADEGLFAKFLEGCLRLCGIAPDLNPLKMDRACFIVSSDLSIRGKTAISPDAKLLQELVNSCALPYVYRTSGTVFDGGLVANLPVDELTSRPGKEFGPIIAVCFSEEAYSRATNGRLNTAMAIMDASIASKTRDLRKVVPDNFVLSLSSDAGDGIVVSSFDVDSFIEFIKSENCWERRYNEARNWLSSRIAQLSTNAADIQLLPSVLTDNEQAKERLRSHFHGISKLAKCYHRHDNIEIINGVFEVISHVKGNDAAAEPDLVRFTDVIKATSGSLNVYVTKLLSSNATHALTVHFEVLDVDQAPMDFVVFEAPELGEQSKVCVIIFLSPLVAGARHDTVTVIQEQKVFGVMEPLFLSGEDYLLTGSDQAPIAKKLEIRLGIPKSFGGLVLEDGTSERMRTLPLDNVAMAELDKQTVMSTEGGSGIRGLPAGFEVFSRTATNVRRGEALRIIYRRKRV
jgi:predicted acylesterase/phospholipase RssA